MGCSHVFSGTSTEVESYLSSVGLAVVFHLFIDIEFLSVRRGNF